MRRWPHRRRPLLQLIVIGVVRFVVSCTGKMTWEAGIKCIEGVMRGDQEHISQMMDAIADLLSEGFLGKRSGHACESLAVCQHESIIYSDFWF
jgi:hypothetical protein